MHQRVQVRQRSGFKKEYGFTIRKFSAASDRRTGYIEKEVLKAAKEVRNRNNVTVTTGYADISKSLDLIRRLRITSRSPETDCYTMLKVIL